MAVIAFWPAIAVAARCTLPLAIRALALGGSTAMICLLLGTQSKGGAVALAVSAVVVFAVSLARLRLLVPTAIVAALGAFATVPLTEPWRREGQGQAFEDAVRHAGTITLVLAAIGTVVGLAYAFADRRAHVSERTWSWPAGSCSASSAWQRSRPSSASSPLWIIPSVRRK